MTISPSVDASQVLRALAACSRALEGLLLQLHNKRMVQSPTTGLFVREYEDGLTVEFYAEASTSNGTSLCWWLEARHLANSQWRILAELLTGNGPEQRAIAEIPSRVTSNDAEFLSALVAYSEKLALLLGESDISSDLTSGA